MANNPYVNKVEYAGQTLMDLTGDTVTPSDVLSGVSFHDRSGAAQQGGLVVNPVYDGLDSTSATDALSANQGRVLNGKIPVIYTETITITTDVNGVATLYTYGASSHAILSTTIIRDGSAYNSWAGFIPGASGDGFLSLKMVDNGVNPVKSLANTTAKVRLVLLRMASISNS